MAEDLYLRYRMAWSKLNVTQKACVKMKQGWEHCSGMAVFEDWPNLFDPDREQDEIELEACRELINQRPELFRKQLDDPA